MGIARELKDLHHWADGLPHHRLKRHYVRALWSEDLSRMSLQSMGLKPPASPTAQFVAPAALLLSMSLPAEALTIQAIDSRNGRPIAGVRVQTNGGTDVGSTNSQGKLEVGTVHKHIRLSKEGYQPLELPAEQLLDQNLLVLTPTAPSAQAEKPQPQAKPQAKPKAQAKPQAKPQVQAKAQPKPQAKPQAQPKPVVKPPVQPKPAQPSVQPTAHRTARPQPHPTVHHTPQPHPIAHETPTHSHRQQAERQYEGLSSYTVKRGDSLYLIAWKVLGDPQRWHEIYELNREQIANPNVIRVGMLLKLPGNRPTTYHIKPGDTLWDIAATHLGSATRWMEIYRLNRTTIPSPRRLMPGQEILLPTR